MLGNTDVYSLTTGAFLEQLFAVDNMFVRQLATLSLENAKNLKIVSAVLKDKVNNRGEIAQKGIHAADKSVIDICKLTPLVGINGSRNLLEEIAQYRWNMLNLQGSTPDDWRRMPYLLLVDYLLSCSVCYVEVFDNTAKVEKFFATRNRFIAGALSGMQPHETVKYSNYLTPYLADYQNSQLRTLKMTILKDGSFKVAQPRAAVNFGKNIKVTPLFLMQTFLEGINPVLAKNIVKFTYIKDNITERELVTTFNPEILLTHYDEGYVQRVMTNVESKLTRGYVRLPELGISKYDDTGVRALNISRITKIDILQEFDTRFIDVDFNVIMPTFKDTVERTSNMNVLAFIFETLSGEIIKANGLMEAQNIITAFADGQYAIGTTTFLRQLHLLMIQFPNIFTDYNGGKPKTFMGYTSSFNLGVE